MKTIILFSLLFLTSNLFAQGFNSITTNDGVNITAVGNNGLVFRSSNSGGSWSSNTYGSDNYMWACSYNNDVWIVGSNGKLFKTIKVLAPLSTVQLPTTNTLNSCDNRGGTGYICGDGGLVYKSVNNGNNWVLANTGIPNVKLNSISFKDENNGIVVGNNGTAYGTTNGGTSWTVQSTFTTKNLLKVKYLSDGIVAVGEWGTILIKTGANWINTQTKTLSDIRGVTGSSVNALRVCGGGGFIRSNNASPEFLKFEMNPMMANLVDICYFDAMTGFAVSSLNTAIIKTTNSGTSWELPSGSSVSFNWIQKINPGNGIGNNLCPHPTNRDAMYVVYGTKVYLSWNKGDSWSQISTISVGTRAHSFYVSPVDTNIWLAAMESSPDVIVRSTDYGATWTTVIARNFSTYGQPLEMDQNNPSTYYFAPDGASTGFFKSTDNGATFNNISSGTNLFTSPCDIIVEWGNSNIMFIGDDQADIHKTTNGGVTWFEVKPASSSEVPSMCNSVFDRTICYATTWSSPQVFKTVNNGNNWNLTSSNTGSGWGSDLCREDPTLVLTGNYGPQAYLTTNSGANFFNINSGLVGSGAGIIVPERGYMLNMQTGALFKLVITYSVVTNIENPVSTGIPTSLELYQNYPNPFNPSTSIKFDVPEAQNISLKIYNSAGKEVAGLFNGMKNAGSYEVHFNAQGLASGIYFYKLVTGNNSITKKMMLIK